MTKKVWFGLVFGLVAMLLVGVVVSGCSQVQEAAKTILKDPGLITTGEATTISGSVKYSGGVADINLNAIIVSGEAVTLEVSKFSVYIGKAGTATSEWTSVDITLPTVTARPMDMVFILDNTGSMNDIIASAKDSIAAFAATLEAAGADVRFGVVSFGDYVTEQATLELPATAEAVASFLNALPGTGGADLPENPLDSINYAYRNFSWRSGAQKVFIVVTDAPCHQLGDGGQNASFTDIITSYEVSSVEAILAGNAVVYAVSPSNEGYKALTYQPTSARNADIRDLADGLGYAFSTNETGSIILTARTTPVPNTGGKWTVLPGTGVLDLNTLGISGVVTRGYTLRFSYTFDAGTWYIHILADTNGDGVMDSDVVLTITIVSGSSVPEVKASAPVPILTRQQLLRMQGVK